ncbi:hypothetical protein J7W08_11035 [Methanococcoides orientis]|uniref:hypothetical protein n=1 Tax=Methanococcoides orientis TaxID=2822137 RepID=UPI001E2CD6D4|nr:hypothetical protein [Methanococcoides orientis]UGV40576.1 hypothetical protein J7W08_11035 [Methanococcoides orientis]
MKKDDFSWKNNEIEYPERCGRIVPKPVFEEKKYPERFGKIIAIPIYEGKRNAAEDHTMTNDHKVLSDEEIGDGIIDTFKERMRNMLSDHRHNQNH